MPKFITIGYGDKAGYDLTAKPMRDAARAADAERVRQGDVMGIAGKPVQVRNHDAAKVEVKQGAFLSADLPIAGFALIEAEEVRGFAIATPEVSALVVNGRDYSQGGKAFTLLHEFCHVLLGESAISNGAGDDPRLRPADRAVERFCDAVAAAALMPRDLLASFPDVANSSGVREWTNDELRHISNVSEQAGKRYSCASSRSSAQAGHTIARWPTSLPKNIAKPPRLLLWKKRSQPQSSDRSYS